MGIGGISVWQLLIVLAIIMLIFGTKKFRNIGGDLGNAVKGFKKAMNEDDVPPQTATIGLDSADDDGAISGKKADKPSRW